MAHPLVTTVPVGAGVGGLIGLAFAPWWAWGAVGAAAGSVYAAGFTLLGVRVAAWLWRGSPEQRLGVTVGGAMGAIVAGLIAAVAAVAQFIPPIAGETSELFAIGALGIFAGGPTGFALGGLAGGLLIAFYEWLDTRLVTPLRAKSVIVDRATKIGAGVGVTVAGALVLVFGLNRRNRRLDVPEWLGAAFLAVLLLGVFWALRLVAKQKRELRGGNIAWMATPRGRAALMVEAVGFAGGAIGFLIGVGLYVFGWRSAPAKQSARKEKRKARPGWWRKRPRG